MFLSLCRCVYCLGLGNVVCLLEDSGNLKLDIVSLAVPEQRVQARGVGSSGGSCSSLLLLEQERLSPLLLESSGLSSSGSSCSGLLLLEKEGLPLLLLSGGGGSGLLSSGLLSAEGVRDEGHDAGGEHVEDLAHHRLGGLGAEAALDLRDDKGVKTTLERLSSVLSYLGLVLGCEGGPHGSLDLRLERGHNLADVGARLGGGHSHGAERGLLLGLELAGDGGEHGRLQGRDDLLGQLLLLGGRHGA